MAYHPTNRDRLTDARRDLAGSHWPIARAIARPFKYAFPGLADEFESAANLALCHAARGFDPGRLVPFATYAASCVRWSLLDVFRETLPPEGEGRRERGEMAMDAMEGLASGDRPERAVDLHDEVEWLLSRLPVDQSRALRLLSEVPEKPGSPARYLALDGLSGVDAAAAMGLTGRAFRRKKRLAIESLSRRFGRR